MLNEETLASTFSLEDVSDSEEFWIMDVPRLVSADNGTTTVCNVLRDVESINLAWYVQIDPQELQGQTIVFDDKSKFRIKDERYCIVAHNASHNVTCVFNSKKDASDYKTGKRLFTF